MNNCYDNTVKSMEHVSFYLPIKLTASLLIPRRLGSAKVHWIPWMDLVFFVVFVQFQ